MASSSLSSNAAAVANASTDTAATDTNNRHYHNHHQDHDYGFVLNKTRIQDPVTGDIGTVLFCGNNVASAKDKEQVYVGILWDEPNKRGKHDGSVVCRDTGRLVRHFRYDNNDSDNDDNDNNDGHHHHPAAASFLKLEKVHRGCLLTPELVTSRYVPLDSPHRITSGPEGYLPHTVSTASGRNDKPVQLLGELHIRQYQQAQCLSQMSLRLQGIVGIDVTADWSSLFPSNGQQPQQQEEGEEEEEEEHHPLTHLDLAGNLLCDWDAVGDILRIFPNTLQHVSLASNRLGDIIILDAKNEKKKKNDAITTTKENLSLSSSTSPLSNRPLLPVSQHLHHINLRATHLRRLDTITYLATTSWTHLQSLCLAQCNFGNQLVATLPNTNNHNDDKSLVVTEETSLSARVYQTAVTWAQALPHLTELDISASRLHQPQQVLVFSLLPSLTSLSLDDNPLTALLPRQHGRQLLFDQNGILIGNEDKRVDDTEIMDTNGWSWSPWPNQDVPFSSSPLGLDEAKNGNSLSSSSPASPVSVLSSSIILFPELRHLQLGGTKLAHWDVLDDLIYGMPLSPVDNDSNQQDQAAPWVVTAPKLDSLRLQNTPWTGKRGAAATRATLVARYEWPDKPTKNAATTSLKCWPLWSVRRRQWTQINGTIVTDRERKDAQRRYVTIVAHEWLQHQEEWKQQSSNAADPTLPPEDSGEKKEEQEQLDKLRQAWLDKHHPQYAVWAAVHPTAVPAAMRAPGEFGQCDPTHGTTLTALALADGILHVQLQSMSAQSCERPPLLRRLPATLTVAQVKAMLARQFGLDVDLQELTVAHHDPSSLSSASVGIPIPLDEDDRTLAYYGVATEGAVIYMHEADSRQTDARSTDLTGTTDNDAFAARVEEQEQQWEALHKRRQQHASSSLLVSNNNNK